MREGVAGREGAAGEDEERCEGGERSGGACGAFADAFDCDPEGEVGGVGGEAVGAEQPLAEDDEAEGEGCEGAEAGDPAQEGGEGSACGDPGSEHGEVVGGAEEGDGPVDSGDFAPLAVDGLSASAFDATAGEF